MDNKKLLIKIIKSLTYQEKIKLINFLLTLKK